MRANNMLHVYVSEPFNQARGITWFAPTFLPGQHLNGFIEAVLVGARAGAGQMAFVEKSEDAGAVDERAEGKAPKDVETDIEPGTITRLAPGEKLSAFTPSQPSATFSEFSKDIKRHLTSLGVNYAPLTSDYSEANYSSMRAAQLVERDLWRELQVWWVDTFQSPVFERWLQTTMLAGQLPIDGRDWRRLTDHPWIPRGWPWVDPLKDVQASEKELELGLSSVTRHLAERGEDLEDILEERRDEMKLAKTYGVSLDVSSSSPRPALATPAEDSDDEGDDEVQDGDAGDEAGARRAGPREPLSAVVAARVRGHAGATPVRNGNHWDRPAPSASLITEGSMGLVKKYKNVLTGAFTNGQIRKSLIVPCREAHTVVARASSPGSAQALGTPAFIFYSSDNEAGQEHSVAGQGYVQTGSGPVTLTNGPAVVSLSHVPTSGTGGGTGQLFYHDWIAIQITAGAGGHLSNFALDLEAWYESDADQMMLEQLNTSSYTPA